MILTLIFRSVLSIRATTLLVLVMSLVVVINSGCHGSNTSSANNDIKSISITGPNTVAVGESIMLTAKAELKNGTIVDITDNVLWSSSDARIATASNDQNNHGEVKGVSTNKAIISATYGTTQKSAQYTITVTALSLDPTAYAVDIHHNSIFACQATSSGIRDCSVALANKIGVPLKMAINTKDNKTYTYITDLSKNSILVCENNMYNCRDINYTFFAPYGIAVYDDLLYVASSGGIQACEINIHDGTLIECTILAHDAKFTGDGGIQISGIKIKKFNNLDYMYFGNLSTSETKIFKCQIMSKFVLSNCEGYEVLPNPPINATVASPRVIDFDDENNFAIVANYNIDLPLEKLFVKFNVNSTTGVLADPTPLAVNGADIIEPTSIVSKRINSQIYYYIGDQSGVNKCKLSNNALECVKTTGLEYVNDIVFNGNDMYIASMQEVALISKTTVNNNGDLDVPVVQNNTLNEPDKIIFGKSTSGRIYGHIINYNNIANCPLENGIFGLCSYNTSADLKPLNDLPKSIDFNGDYAYFTTNAISGEQVVSCKYSVDNKFKDCKNAGLNIAGFSESLNIAFSRIGNQMKAYVAGNGKIAICNASSDGILSNCVNDAGVYNGLNQIYIKDSYVYLLYFNKVSSCSIDASSANIVKCIDVVMPFLNYHIAVSSKYAYITNHSIEKSFITKCDILYGSLVNCKEVLYPSFTPAWITIL